ncbi:hypothetical protein GCM10022416_25540 [Actinomadura keratinilytica]|uniref:Transposase n=1 Tax=Actinomadura keratinilytica TaxID=547461 RepID=A0ABP7YPQ5_9ACTN
MHSRQGSPASITGRASPPASVPGRPDPASTAGRLQRSSTHLRPVSCKARHAAQCGVDQCERHRGVATRHDTLPTRPPGHPLDITAVNESLNRPLKHALAAD